MPANPSAVFADFAAKLHGELDVLQARKRVAEAVGDNALVAALAARIDAVERELVDLHARVRELAGRSFRFEIVRDGNGLLAEVIARPIA